MRNHHSFDLSLCPFVLLFVTMTSFLFHENLGRSEPFLSFWFGLSDSDVDERGKDVEMGWYSSCGDVGSTKSSWRLCGLVVPYLNKVIYSSSDAISLHY